MMQKLKVLLTNAPGLELEEFDKSHNKIRGYGLYPPIQLTLLAGMISKEVENSFVEVLDLELEIRKYFNENIKSTVSAKDVMKKLIADKIDEFKPDLVGISVVFSPGHKNTLTIADIVKEKNSEIHVVCGGNHATFAYKTMLENCSSIDFIFLYEADKTFPSFLQYINGKTKFEDLKGIVWLDKITKKIKQAPRAPLIQELDEIPIPKWNLVPIKKYQQYGRIGAIQRYGNEDLPSYTMQTVRGCVASCTFCSVRSFYGKEVRAFSAKRVLEEIDYLYNDLGITQLEILDDDFTFNKQRTLEICNGLIKRNYNLIWNLLNGIRLSTINEEVLDSLVKAKCRSFSVGVESGNDSTLATVRKPLSIKMLYEKSEMFQKHNELYVTGNYMVGFPFESEKEMMNTYDVARDIGFDWNVFTVFRPLAGTPLFENLDDKEKKKSIEEQKDYNEGFSAARRTRRLEAKKYQKEIENQMKASLMHVKEENENKENFGDSEIDKLNYIKNLEINFLNNKNLNGAICDKYLENKKGKYRVQLNKVKNIDRAIKDFEGVVKFIEKDHAIAHYCLAKAYRVKGDDKLVEYHSNKVLNILSDPINSKWVEYFDKLLSKKEIDELKKTHYKKIPLNNQISLT